MSAADKSVFDNLYSNLAVVVKLFETFAARGLSG
jgi:hypothetical protein